MRPFFIIPSIVAAAVTAVAAPDSPQAGGKLKFNRDIRPILSDTCFACHGPDEKKRDSGLRLDIRADAISDRDGIRAIVPGKPAESELYLRITTTDEEDIMPPRKTHKTIKPEQVQTIKRWIEEGAEYEGHWAFTTPTRPVPPVAAPGAIVRNPIDQFVTAKLASAGMKQTPEADKPTLIRRAALDLTGLPPTPEEVNAFLADNSPNAYEKVVDRLLASPRYGERMAIEWLDYARYADSNGFQTDSSRTMWPWRNWVIESFNRNVPFDQFTIEQLAGDMLPNASRDQIVATGFNRNHRLNGEGGRIVEEWFAETVIDRVETTGSTWLALTFNCCRCHDHKYDPITQREFYQMFAFFNSIEESGVEARGDGGNTMPYLNVLTPEQEKQIAMHTAELAALEKKAQEAEAQLPAAQIQWEAGVATKLQQNKDWQPLAAATVTSQGGATMTRQPDGSWLAGGNNAANEIYTVRGPISAGDFTGIRVEALPDASLPNQSLGRASNGNFVLSGVEAEITAPGAKPVVAKFTKAEADFEQDGYPAKSVLDRKAGWAIAGNVAENRKPRKAMFLLASPIKVPTGAQITVRLRHESPNANHHMGRFRLDTTSHPPAMVKLGGVPDTVLAALAVDAAKRSPAQRDVIAKYFRNKVENPFTTATAEVAAVRKKLEDAKKSGPSTMVMKELPKPREAFILNRGEYDKKGAPVARALPAALPPMPAGAPLNRLGLAQWIASPQNPLTARVWVNRTWERLFGMGLSRATENFGSQAEWPSNPELLDWLATEFVRLKWDMKAMQKTMVMSATYRQSSRVTPELLEKDPDNRLLARGPRFRLPAEVIRDQALAISGLLVEKIGGPSVKPYMPDRVWDETSVYGDMRGYKADAGEGLYRRSLYTVWKRTASPPSMTMFDSPTREICTVKRSRTNTPLQALSLLNEITFVEAARVLAQRMIASAAAPEQRIAWAFKRATCREPAHDELKILAAGLAKRLAMFREDPAAAKQITSLGASPADPKADPVELAAYTVTANVLLNLDEVVSRN